VACGLYGVCGEEGGGIMVQERICLGDRDEMRYIPAVAWECRRSGKPSCLM